MMVAVDDVGDRLVRDLADPVEQVVPKKIRSDGRGSVDDDQPVVVLGDHHEVPALGEIVDPVGDLTRVETL